MIGTSSESKAVFKSPFNGYSHYNVELYTNTNLDKNAPYFKVYKSFMLNDVDKAYFTDMSGEFDEDAYNEAVKIHQKNVADFNKLVESIKDGSAVVVMGDDKRVLKSYDKATEMLSKGQNAYAEYPITKVKGEKIDYIKTIGGNLVNIFVIQDNYNGKEKNKIGIRMVDYSGKEIYDIVMSESVTTFNIVNALLNIKDFSIPIVIDFNGNVYQNGVKCAHFYGTKDIEKEAQKNGKNYETEAEKTAFKNELIERSKKANFTAHIIGDRIYFAVTDFADIEEYADYMEEAYGFAVDKRGKPLSKNADKKNRYFVEKLPKVTEAAVKTFSEYLAKIGFNVEIAYNGNRSTQKYQYTPLSSPNTTDSTSNSGDSSEESPF